LTLNEFPKIKPQAASRKPQAASRKPQAASRKPQAGSTDAKAQLAFSVNIGVR